MADEKNFDRRSFFQESLRRAVGKLANPLEKVAAKIGDFDSAAPALPRWLRPPGALNESEFETTCTRHGDCVRVCPAHCIKIDPAGVKGGGLPYIDADEMACVVCTGLECMNICPSGALALTAPVDIDMGTALWRRQTCVRDKGEACQICVEKCPIGSAAIEVTPRGIQVHDQGCIGCGLCQQYCPTTPKSIVVVPRGI